jgi:lipoprotein signal peptidase
MATVLPFDPHARRRTPARPATPAQPSAADAREERVVPLRVVREPAPTVRERVVARLAVAPEAAPDVARTDGELARRFFPLVLLAALADLATKGAALALLADRSIALAGPLSLQLAHNTVSAGAAWLGATTPAANVAATGAVLGVLVMLTPALHRLAPRATAGLALMVGGGLGNLTSLVAAADGVPDFMRVEHARGAWVLNLADLCMLAGLTWLVASLVRALRGPAPQTTALPTPIPAAARVRRAALSVVRCALLVAVGAAGLLYAQRERMVGATACLPGTPLVFSGLNPFARLDAGQRAATLAHEAAHAAQIREQGCLAVYRRQLFGSPVERAALEVEAGCAELAAAPAAGVPRAAAESTLARTVVSAYPSLRATGFARALALTRTHCAT